MTKLAYKDEEGKLVKLNTATDECLWSGRWRNNREQNRFTEFYTHLTKGGKRIFYTCYVTYWQGESNEIEPLTDDEAREWVIDHYGELREQDLARLEELGIKVEETA